MSDADDLIDAFVAAVNSRPRDLRLTDEIAESVRLPADDPDFSAWHIIPCDGRTWIGQLADSLPARLPETFESLVTRYCFPAMEVGPIVIHGNTVEGSDYFEFRPRLFADRYMSPFLLQHGFIQFGQPSDWSYDPVCFDIRSRRKREYSVVRLDHEEILIRQRVRILDEIAPSLRQIIERFLAEAAQ